MDVYRFKHMLPRCQWMIWPNVNHQAAIYTERPHLELSYIWLTFLHWNNARSPWLYTCMRKSTKITLKSVERHHCYQLHGRIQTKLLPLPLTRQAVEIIASYRCRFACNLTTTDHILGICCVIKKDVSLQWDCMWATYELQEILWLRSTGKIVQHAHSIWEIN